MDMHKKDPRTEEETKTTDKVDNSEEREITENQKEIDLISSAVDDFSEMEEIKKKNTKKSVEHLVKQRPNAKIEEKAQKYLEKQKDYGIYETVRTDYPLFIQLPNACGLSSVLMLLDPIQNEKIGRVLDDVWKIFHQTTAIEQRRKEFQWAYSLDYLLLKSASSNAISEYIQNLNSEELENYYIGLESVLRFHQQGHYDAKNDLVVETYEDYFTHGWITPWIVSQHVDLFKHNPEIQILMAIFGYEYVRQPSPDGTGALFFTEQELKNLDLTSAKKKIKVLQSEFIKGARIIGGFSFHWVVLTNVFTSKGKLHLSINDPEGKRYSVPLQNLTDRDRFYIYRKAKERPKKLWKDIGEILKKDGPKEVEITNKILETIKERHEKAIDSESHIKMIKDSEEAEPATLKNLPSIPVVVHEKTVKSLKREKNKEKKLDVAEKTDNTAQKKIPPDSSSKEAFMKKMRKIIGDNLQTNNKK